jgi:hypothetical protein
MRRSVGKQLCMTYSFLTNGSTVTVILFWGFVVQHLLPCCFSAGSNLGVYTIKGDGEVGAAVT